MHVRPEAAGDRAAIWSVHETAFGQPDEADLVDQLRKTVRPYLGFVAEVAGRVVGHIAFSPVDVERAPKGWHAMGLAPMAVLPGWQRRGVGTALVETGLAACRRHGSEAVVVLGHPDYYRRFGFRRAADCGLQCTYDVPPEVFMVLPLRPGALAAVEGTVRYASAFDAVG